MKSYQQYRLPAKDMDRNLRRNLPVLVETLELPEGIQQDTIYAFQHKVEQLRACVTDLQDRNCELEASAHMIAHDLKDLLAVLVLSSNLITDIPDLTPQEMDESLQQIKTTAFNMNRIINNILLFAEVSKAEAPVELVDMTWIVEHVRDRLSPMIKEHQAQITIPDTWPEAIGYAPWLEEVWANYISNALKHGGKPPCVDLGASTQPDGMVRFWTRDNGPGLPPEGRNRLFVPFNQISHTRTLRQGVGLSIVLHIVEKLGGQVGVESEFGNGSRFFFTLPASQ